MLTQKLFLQGAVLSLVLCPSIIMGASFPPPKRSTLPCLTGNPFFSQALIKNNPVSSRRHALSDSILWSLVLTEKMDAISVNKIRRFQVPSFNWNPNYMAKIANSIHTTPLLEFGVYLNRFSMLYLASRKDLHTYALIIGNDSQPFNAHVSIGKFPIHFGSGFSEYPFESPLQAKMGTAANLPAISLNLENYWSGGHKTQGMWFGFVRAAPGNERYLNEKKFGFKLSHEWKPQGAMSRNIDNITAGISWAKALPIYFENLANHDGADLHLHINSGPLKIIFEGMVENPGRFYKRQETSRSFFSDTKSVKSASRRSASRGPRGFSWLHKLKSGYVGHTEVSYKLPLRKDTLAICGYTWANTAKSLRVKERFFVGFKFGVSENMHYIVGYQREGRLDLNSPHTITLQCNFTL